MPSLRPVPNAQVEFNAPLRPVAAVPSAAVRMLDASVCEGDFNAADAAAAHRTALHAREVAKLASAARFRKETLMRLKEKAQSKRDEAAAVEAAAAEEKRQAATASVIVSRPAQEPPQARSQSVSSGGVPSYGASPVPSQLASLRAGLTEQAYAARMAMLSQCELGEIYAAARPDEADAVAQGRMPPGYDAPPSSSTPVAASGLMRVDPATCKSTLRAVTVSAAVADRQAAREARRKRDAAAERSARKAQLSAAAKAEKIAQARAEALRREVESLEMDAAEKERELTEAHLAKQSFYESQKTVEVDRFFDALRTQLRGEAAFRSRPLPPLDGSGLDPLDNHTELGARNSIFFNNPAAYGRALSGLFVRPIVLD